MRLDFRHAAMIAQGDIDEAVRVTNTRMWVDTMKELGLNYEYVEQPGITHGPVIESGLNLWVLRQAHLELGIANLASAKLAVVRPGPRRLIAKTLYLNERTWLGQSRP